MDLLDARREKLGGLVKPERARRSVPALRVEGLRGCGVYQDAWTHDGRLCLANVTAAAEAGATVLNYAEVVDLRLVGGQGARRRGARSPLGRDRLGRGARGRQRHRAVARHAAPARGPGVAPYGQLSKGVHVTLPLDEPWSAALTIPHDQVRVTFAYPWEGMLLLGTTDTLYEGDPAEVAATDEDIDQVLAEAASPSTPACCARRACSRPTPACGCCRASDGSTVDARRETAFLTGTGGMLTVAGGKLTTYRRIALDALDRLSAELGLVRRRPPAGAASRARRDAGNVAARLVTGWDLEPAVAAHLAHFYGLAGGPRRRPCGRAARAPRAAAPRRARHRRPGRVRGTGGMGDERRRRRAPAHDARRPRSRDAGVVAAWTTSSTSSWDTRRRPPRPLSDWIGHTRRTKES